MVKITRILLILIIIIIIIIKLTKIATKKINIINRTLKSIYQINH
jgi:hypothetical protein